MLEVNPAFINTSYSSSFQLAKSKAKKPGAKVSSERTEVHILTKKIKVKEKVEKKHPQAQVQKQKNNKLNASSKSKDDLFVYFLSC